jgi:hypothetical protein
LAEIRIPDSYDKAKEDAQIATLQKILRGQHELELILPERKPESGTDNKSKVGSAESPKKARL